MMNFAALLRAFDAVLVFGDAVSRLKKKGDEPPAETALSSRPSDPVGAQLEARLTNVVVAALKEAFDRDHARLELERAHLDEQRRRADAALRAEQRRQAIERETARLRLIAGSALVAWIVSVVLLAARLPDAPVAPRVLGAVGSLLLIGGCGAAFSAQGRLGADAGADGVDTRGAAVALWLLLGGLALHAVGLAIKGMGHRICPAMPDAETT
jgi:hypothetical protein